MCLSRLNCIIISVEFEFNRKFENELGENFEVKKNTKKKPDLAIKTLLTDILKKIKCKLNV